MKSHHLTYLGLGAVAVGAYVYWRYQRGGSDPVSEAILTVTDSLVKGARLTTTTLDDSGVIRVDPDVLTAQAVEVYGSDFGVEGWSAKEVYALARMSRSEAGAKAGKLERKARMHIALNDFNAVSWAHSLDELFTYSTNSDKKGFFGSQSTRRYSTAQDPYEGDVKLALEVLAEDAANIDPTGGAVKFVDKSSLASQPGVTKTYDQIVAAWGQEGLKPANVDGLSSDFVVFRKA